MGRGRIISAVVVGLIFAIPTIASASEKIGQTFTPSTDFCVGPITFLQSASPQSSYAVPSSGVLTSWSYQASATVSPIKFKVGRRVSGDSFRVVAESDLVTPATNTLNTYPIQATVAPGDVIGIYFTGTAGCTRVTAGYEDHYFGGDLLPGQESVFMLDDESYQLDVSAQFEPYQLDVSAEFERKKKCKKKKKGKGKAAAKKKCKKKKKKKQ